MKSISLAVVATAATFLLPLVTQAVQFTNNAYSGIEAGKTFTLYWSGDGSPVEITLKTGPSKDLTTVKTLATSAAGTGATVTIPDDVLPDTMYAFAVTQSGTTNYSPQFTIAVPSPVTAHPVSTPTSLSPSTSDSESNFQTSAFLAALAMSTTTTHTSTQTHTSTTKSATHTPPSPSPPSAHFYAASASSASHHASSGLAIIHSAPVVLGPFASLPTLDEASTPATKTKTSMTKKHTATGSQGYYYGGTSTPEAFTGAAAKGVRPTGVLGWGSGAMVAAAAGVLVAA